MWEGGVRRGELREEKRERKSWNRGEDGGVLRSPPHMRGGGREWRKEERRGGKDEEELGWEYEETIERGPMERK